MPTYPVKNLTKCNHIKQVAYTSTKAYKRIYQGTFYYLLIIVPLSNHCPKLIIKVFENKKKWI